MLRKRRQVDERARTSVTEEQERNIWETSSVARYSNSILAVTETWELMRANLPPLDYSFSVGCIRLNCVRVDRREAVFFE